MTRRAPWWRRLSGALRGRRLDRDFAVERAAHLQLAADDLERRGMSRDEARREARLSFGSEAAAVDGHREARGLPTLDNLGRDLRHALRRMRRDAWLTTAVVLILGLGIGANTAVVSVIRPILLKGLPFDRGDELVWISNIGTSGLSGATFQVDTYEGLKQRAWSFADWTAYFPFSSYGTNTLTGLGDPERLHVMNVAPRFFELLGVTPAIGRLFTLDEQALNGPGAVLVGHDYWQRRLGSRADIVGTLLRINDRPVLVAGVLPASFDFASVFAPGTRVDFYRPAILDEMRPWGNTLSVIGRLAPGVSLDEARGAGGRGAGPPHSQPRALSVRRPRDVAAGSRQRIDATSAVRALGRRRAGPPHCLREPVEPAPRAQLDTPQGVRRPSRARVGPWPTPAAVDD